MKYYEIQFTIAPCTDDARDVLSAMAGEAGCESVEETADGLNAYAQQQLFDQSMLDVLLEDFPFEGVGITYYVREAEDRDWNEQWEQEGFEPIIVESLEFKVESLKKEALPTIIIHDGRHLPADFPRPDNPSLNSKLSALNYIEIDAHQAFGTGTHETTRMICAALLGMPLKGKRVLDCGCGTGILGICALKLGADSCTAYDIDEWSVENTHHNAVINMVDSRITVLHGNAQQVLTKNIGQYDLVMANINRNILLQDMPLFRRSMAPGATLILSGFYETDCALLESKAQEMGLKLVATHTDGPWASMVLH